MTRLIILYCALVSAAVLAAKEPRAAQVGVLQATAARASAYAEAGVTHVVLDLSWDRFEPEEGRVDPQYVKEILAVLRTFESANLSVILDFGIQYPPEWLFQLPNSRYQNQYGDNFVDPSPGMRMANAVFNRAIRSRQADYVEAVFKHLGRDFFAVRLGWGWFGELNYPPHEYRGNRNAYWAFDPIAQGQKDGLPDGIETCPIPGWIPGGGGVDDEADKFINWYLGSLQNYHDWQIQTVRLWYDGRLLMLYPSWGIRPGQLDTAVASGLQGVTPAERNGEIQRGFDFARFVAGIQDPGVILHTTWLDTDPSFGNDAGTDSAGWSPLHFLQELADQHPLSLAVSGENTGGGGMAILNLCAERIDRYGGTLFLWAFESDLFDATAPHAQDLSTAFSRE